VFVAAALDLIAKTAACRTPSARRGI